MRYIDKDNDFDYFYAHIRIACITFLEKNYSEHFWKFKNFSDMSLGEKKLYGVTYSSLNTDGISYVHICLTISIEHGKISIKPSKILSGEE